jgi:hypothetical protein
MYREFVAKPRIVEALKFDCSEKQTKYIMEWLEGSGYTALFKLLHDGRVYMEVVNMANSQYLYPGYYLVKDRITGQFRVYTENNFPKFYEYQE